MSVSALAPLSLFTARVVENDPTQIPSMASKTIFRINSEVFTTAYKTRLICSPPPPSQKSHHHSDFITHSSPPTPYSALATLVSLTSHRDTKCAPTSGPLHSLPLLIINLFPRLLHSSLDHLLQAFFQVLPLNEPSPNTRPLEPSSFPVSLLCFICRHSIYHQRSIYLITALVKM